MMRTARRDRRQILPSPVFVVVVYESLAPELLRRDIKVLVLAVDAAGPGRLLLLEKRR